MRNGSLVIMAVGVFAMLGLLPELAAADNLDLPARKPGAWQTKMIANGKALAMSTTICLDAATDKALMAAGLNMTSGACTGMQQSRDGNTITIDATCTFGGATIKSHSVVSGDFQAAYSINVVSDRVAGTSPLPAHSEITQQMTWIGECADGMKPGEMMMPNGMKVDMLKAMGGG